MAAKRKANKVVHGRQGGGHNRGYWYQSGRGWFVTENAQPAPLLAENGAHLKDRHTPTDELDRAYARHILGQQKKAKQSASGDTTPLLRIVQVYLQHCKANNRESTFNKRGEYLFDFCYGLPARFWDYDSGRKVPKPAKEDYLHDGYGAKPVGELLPMDVQHWLDKHPTWGKGTRRIAVQGLKRALNYAVSMKLTPLNPIRGFKIGVGGKRVTFFTPEVEKVLLQNAFQALRTAISVCIRTGARYGSEFIPLTAAHVEETPKGMLWRFSSDESKTHKPRTIYVAPEIADIVRPLMKRYQKTPLFRNQHGDPWTINALRRAFLRLKDRLAKKKIRLDDDACMYTCRHTFAKRTLGGYWKRQALHNRAVGRPDGKHQAGLLGTLRQVVRQLYRSAVGGGRHR